jgi:hypothetical protein
MRQKLTTAALVIALGVITYDRVANHSHTANAAGKTFKITPTLSGLRHGDVTVDGEVKGFSCVELSRPTQSPECYVLTEE